MRSPTSCVVIATIIKIHADDDWYYVACTKCGKKVDRSVTTLEDGDTDVTQTATFDCGECGTVTDVYPRIKVQIRVQDDTGSISFVLFERDVTAYIGKPASVLLKKYKKIDDNGIYPEEFNSFINKRFAFKIRISEYNLKNNYRVYMVNKLSDDVDIIDVVLKNSTVEDIPSEDDTHLLTSDQQELDSSSKANMSLMGENITPRSSKRRLEYGSQEFNSGSTSATPSNGYDVGTDPIILSISNRYFGDLQASVNGSLLLYSSKIRRRILISEKRRKSLSFPKRPRHLLSLQHSFRPDQFNPKKRACPGRRQDQYNPKKRACPGPRQHENTVLPSTHTNTDHLHGSSSTQTDVNLIRPYTHASAGTQHAQHEQVLPRNISFHATSSQTPFTLTPTFDNGQSSTTINRATDNINSRSTTCKRAYVPDYPVRPGYPKKRRMNLPTIPRFQTPDTETDDMVQQKNKSIGICSEYLDVGDPDQCCKTCKALLWYDEATTNNPYLTKPSFSLCCGGGKVQLSNLKKPPTMLLDLYSGKHAASKDFLDNIRRYNIMFSFTSLGAKVDHRVNSGHGPYVYRIHGQNYHSIGDLFPQEGQPPKFCQLYIFDTDNELNHRFRAFDVNDLHKLSITEIQSTPFWIAHQLKGLLDEINPLVKQFRMAKDRIIFSQNDDVKLILIGRRETDGRQYNLPTASEVAALIVGDIDGNDNRDIILEKHSGTLQRINELHPSYLALQYPLLFPYAEDRFRTDILHRDIIEASTSKRNSLTMRQFSAYRIQQRTNEVSLLLMARRLFQQFLVDIYTMVESQRLNYFKFNQKVLRICPQNNLKTFHNQGNTDGSKTGNRLVIPSSFTEGTRYMRQNYLDAMTLCKWYGYPDLFITITCNPKWPEILRFLEKHGLKPEDRPDITTCMFKMKLDMLISDLKDNEIIGAVKAIVYTVEFQKCGLPHCHICLFLEQKIANPQEADRFISAEIPNIDDDAQLYELVSEFMMHGPCGEDNPKCPCMIKDKCSKKFPKKFSEETHLDEDGFPIYKRRNLGHRVKKGSKWLDNRNVVGYNGTLLKRYQSHINTEWCNQVGSIKYLFKYVNKGHDRITAAVCRPKPNNSEAPTTDKKDEFEEWYDCRYISACEACWRLFAFDIHYRTPSIQRLSFHIEGSQPVVYDGEEPIEDALAKPSVAKSQFLGWFQFPTKFVWNATDRKWTPREKGFSIGRLHHVPPKVGDLYYLRILLNIVKGATSYEDINTVDGKYYETFKEACQALGLLDDDNEYICCIKETNQWASAEYCRSIFVMLIMSDSLSRPEHVWEETWEILSEDINYIRRKETGIPDLNLSTQARKNHALAKIEQLLVANGSSLKNIPNMPFPDYIVIQESCNMLIHRELCYDQKLMNDLHNTLYSTMTDEQKDVYTRVMAAVDKNDGGVFFLYGYGGTGKTYIWKTLSSAIRSKGEIVLNVASSGIASLLLEGGKTAHSRFRIPININEDSFCSITPDSDLAALIVKTRLIIWDEAPMMHRHCFEALDKTLRNILASSSRASSDKPFGGKVILFGGDFRQILPVIQRGTRAQIVNASINSSDIWRHCTVLRLTENMRLKLGSPQSSLTEVKAFSDWLIQIGEGTIGDNNKGGEADVQFPDDVLIKSDGDHIKAIVDAIYPNINDHLHEPGYFRDKAILVPTNDEVDRINDHVLSLIKAEERTYFSSDRPCETESLDAFQQSLYSPDVLNGFKISDTPNHKLLLKPGVPVMLLRNIDQSKGLCNGTRLQVVRMAPHVIEAKIISGSNVNDVVYIPRMKITPSDIRISFKFQRRQFPLVVCFAMTINKSQGQSLAQVGLFLQRPVFTHGQLYVALSRVTTKSGLKVLIVDKGGKTSSKTTNVVYKEVLQKI
uniref:uncharacterized protein LOC122583457 n=1 Tax=Erigeron canadensis TaxID=72917 RepID=UPI001CB9B864|nr:uncharacterized protein LOC122583457 [Erigeron canadensis]